MHIYHTLSHCFRCKQNSQQNKFNFQFICSFSGYSIECSQPPRVSMPVASANCSRRATSAAVNFIFSASAASTTWRSFVAPIMGIVPLAIAQAIPTCEQLALCFSPIAFISSVRASSCGSTGLYFLPRSLSSGSGFSLLYLPESAPCSLIHSSCQFSHLHHLSLRRCCRRHRHHLGCQRPGRAASRSRWFPQRQCLRHRCR